MNIFSGFSVTFPLGLSRFRFVWIGLHDPHEVNYYEWTDNTTVVYTNWANGEPNNWRGNHEGCVEMRLEVRLHKIEIYM